MQINERLKELRKQNNKTQQQIADIIGVLKQQYYRYEKNRNPQIEHLIILCKYYNISADYILGLTDKKKPLD